MRFAMALLLAFCVFLSGCCAQLGEAAMSEIPLCMEKCSDLCDAAKAQSVDLGGYTQIGLTKKSGNVEVSCSCVCP